MNTLVSTMLCLLSLTQTSPRPPVVTPPSARPARPQAVYPPPQTVQPVARLEPTATVQATFDVAATNQLSDQGLWEQASQTVLVVPTPDLLGANAQAQEPGAARPAQAAPEGVTRVAQLTQDMTVMCRILDKVAAAPSSVRYAVRTPGVAQILSADDFRTQGLYLAGYGALFFIAVDFPLRPPQPEQSQPAGEPTTDPVWSQTVEELRGSASETRRVGAPTQGYDAQRVETLEASLIKALRHAANLRLASAQDLITLVVSCQGDRVPLSLKTRRGGAVAAAVPGAANVAPENTSSVLILRVSKADIDVVALGEMSLEEFTKKVQSLWSPANPATTSQPVGLPRSR